MDILSRDLHSEDGVVSAAIGEAADRLEEISNENEKLKIELEEAKNYANELVDHKNMICLPADLANLRKANADFAMENHKLQEKIKVQEDALDRISRHGVIMGSVGVYRDGQIDAFNTARDIAEKALTNTAPKP